MITKSLKEFCHELADIDELTTAQRALAILLWNLETGKASEMSSGELSRIMREYGLGSPNSTALKESISKTKLATRSGNVFKLKIVSKKIISTWIRAIIDEKPPQIPHEDGFLPSAVWEGTRGYIEKVCIQLNGCYKFEFYDASAVLARRIIETLIIEAYIHQKRDTEIKDKDGNYFMLAGLVGKALADNTFNIGRDTKKHLTTLKELGDRSAHKRNYNAIKNDLLNIKTPLRVVVDELINLADIKRKHK